jgi:hypothetical protein
MEGSILRRVAILSHERDQFESTGYFLFHMASLWREQGMQIVIVRGTGKPVDADIAILHVDLTIVPRSYRRYLRTFPRTLNSAVTDISKRHVSRHLVHPGDGYAGPVIVKTDRNSGGTREAGLRKQGVLARRLSRKVFARLPWTFRSTLPSHDYHVFESRKQVPAAIWLNPRIVVERFLPERSGEFYCLRTWTFLGEKETNSLSYAREPVVKSTNVVRRDVVVEIPEELRRMRLDLGFDYGKFDYAVSNGEVVLYDANRTPAFGGLSTSVSSASVRLLAEGLESFLA